MLTSSTCIVNVFINTMCKRFIRDIIPNKRSKNRLGAETIAALPLLLCSCYALPRRPCVLCERSHPLTWAPKKIRAAYALLTLAVWNRRYTRTHTLAHSHTRTHTRTHTHTHVGFYGLQGLSIGVMVFILCKLYVLLSYTYPTPKLSPHRRLCISIFPQKNS